MPNLQVMIKTHSVLRMASNNTVQIDRQAKKYKIIILSRGILHIGLPADQNKQAAYSGQTCVVLLQDSSKMAKSLVTLEQQLCFLIVFSFFFCQSFFFFIQMMFSCKSLQRQKGKQNLALCCYIIKHVKFKKAQNIS